ncbi:YciI family protein [Nocardioides zeae]|uniref:YciI family protein n=1 Tax=Nocardioides imazamoxiresistens TaxID=3231893 RepID=A0ABU3Q0U0_9ACTN|nr:YciI family protein [Nocardioides zeae]MDT9594726.1 YciI family protein [Nocardioides zeae]
MSIYAVTYTYSDDVALRDAERPAHREYLAGLGEAGQLVVSGPWGPDEAAGALLLLRADSAEAARALTAADPFVKVGVVVDQTVREFLPVLGPGKDVFA